jgi:hypothetical protein
MDPLLTEAAELISEVAHLPEAVRKERSRFCGDTFGHAHKAIRFEVATGKPAVEILFDMGRIRSRPSLRGELVEADYSRHRDTGDHDNRTSGLSDLLLAKPQQYLTPALQLCWSR